MLIEVQQDSLVIRIGQRETKLMKMEWMKSPVEEESSLRKAEHTEQYSWRKRGRKSIKEWLESVV